MARAAMTAVCCRMIEIVAGCANRGLMMVKTMKATISTSSGLSDGMGVQQVLDALDRRLLPQRKLFRRGRRRLWFY